MLFPWEVCGNRSVNKDITACGDYWSYVTSSSLGVWFCLASAIALLNAIFQQWFYSVPDWFFLGRKTGSFAQNDFQPSTNSSYPTSCYLLSGSYWQTLGILGSHFAGDFFLGIDIMVSFDVGQFPIDVDSLLILYQKETWIGIRKFTNFQIKALPKKLIALLLNSLTIRASHYPYAQRISRRRFSAWYFHSTPVCDRVDWLGLRFSLFSELEKT